jgi:hypothetical protein
MIFTLRNVESRFGQTGQLVKNSQDFVGNFYASARQGKARQGLELYGDN